MSDTNNVNVVEQLRREHEEVFGPNSCPTWAKESFERYVEHGIPTGDCLRAVLANDLMAAFMRADVDTAKRMPAIVSYVYNELPHDCHGSYELVDRWLFDRRAARLPRREEPSE